jgi:hypothetical protein
MALLARFGTCVAFELNQSKHMCKYILSVQHGMRQTKCQFVSFTRIVLLIGYNTSLGIREKRFLKIGSSIMLQKMGF